MGHQAESDTMNWFVTAQRLPTPGDPVEFLVEDREIVIDGRYEDRAFRSRWGEYRESRVSVWRPKPTEPLMEERA
jgi:hypothetical protein